MTAPRLLLGACGSGNLLSLPQHVLAIRARGEVEIRAVLTRSAATILPPSALGLICDEVYCDGVDELRTGHVRLAAWADRLVVLPATANVLGQAACGLASGLLTSTLLAAAAPVLYFPSMNRRMWTQPAVRRNVVQLRADGHIIIDPVMAEAWEIATQGMRTNPGLPSPAVVSSVVAEFLAPEGISASDPDLSGSRPVNGRGG